MIIEAMTIRYDDAHCREIAAELLRRHEELQAEANITSGIREFLVQTGLVESREIREEISPAEGSSNSVDLAALDTLIEVKRRIGNGIVPDGAHVGQLDGYLTAAMEASKGVRIGVLTDGKYWILRWPNAVMINTSPPYAFTLTDADRWYALYEWLRDNALAARRDIEPTSEELREQFSPASPLYEREIDTLRALYERFSGYETVAVKRRLWHDLLRTALGEVVEGDEFDDLFVRHTYLTMVVGIVVQATFGMKVKVIAENDPEDLLRGRQFAEATGLHGVVESDFFSWPIEVGATPLIRTIARRVARFDWSSPPSDIAATLYQTVIPASERRQLGEYYTPRWLAKAIVKEIVTDPVNQRVLDPSCGSGTFIAECVEHFLEAAKQQNVPDTKIFEMLRDAVTGIDIHPVATHLARAAWVIAARPAIAQSVSTAVTVPIYLGDSLQLRYESRGMFAAQNVTIGVGDDENTELIFPVSLVNHAESFDQLMVDVAEYMESGNNPKLAMEDVPLTDGESATLSATVDKLAELHAQGRDHIWAYYTRNLVRPITLARNKVDVIVGNPPWISYNRTTDALRKGLAQQGRHEYGIWTGSDLTTQQDVASLFFARTTDLYLRDSGIIGMVMPNSALISEHYRKLLSGEWSALDKSRTLYVDFSFKKPWDLERLNPNTFFPNTSSVIFARRVGEDGKGTSLGGLVEVWTGPAGSDQVKRTALELVDTTVGHISPYANIARNGATLYPRVLLMVDEIPNPATVSVRHTITTKPRRGTYDKDPWRSLELPSLQSNTIEQEHAFATYLGESVIPYATLDPLTAVLPINKERTRLERVENDQYGIAISSLGRRMRDRWRQINRSWEQNRKPTNTNSLIDQIDHWGKLSSQLEWLSDQDEYPLRVVYTKSGEPTATIVREDDAIVDNLLYWVRCSTLDEAHYLLAIINSRALYEAVRPFMPKGQFGARDVHKHLWRLPIPEFDGGDSLHVSIAGAGRQAAAGVERELGILRRRYPRLTVTIARREIRKWLRESVEGKRVEEVVGELLGG